MKICNYKHFIFFVAILTVVIACDDNRNDPGYRFFPDMDESQAYETWSENPYFPGGKTMVGPVEGTVAIHEYAYNFEKTPEDELKAASLVNPFAGELDTARTKIIYDRFCLVCHGPDGNGQGFLFTSGKYPIPPASYQAERAMNKTDGQLFHNIRVGFGVMGAYGPQVSIEDTWQLVNYIRLMQSQDSN